MTLTELKYVVAVAAERHFGRAAERVFVSQPSLSAAVKSLEDELGVRIFERGKGEVLVTPVGEEKSRPQRGAPVLTSKHATRPWKLAAHTC